MQSKSKWNEDGLFEATALCSSVGLLMLSGAITPLILTDLFRVSLTSVISMSSFIALNIAAASAPSYVLGALTSYENRKIYESIGCRGLLFAATTAIAGYLEASSAANLACSLAVQALPMLADHARDFFNNPATKTDTAIRALQCSFFAGTAIAASVMFDLSWPYMVSTAILAASTPIFAKRVGLGLEGSLISGAVFGAVTGLFAIGCATIAATHYIAEQNDYSPAIVGGKLAIVAGLTALNMCSLAIKANQAPQNALSVPTLEIDFNIERELFGKGSDHKQKPFSSFVRLC